MRCALNIALIYANIKFLHFCNPPCKTDSLIKLQQQWFFRALWFTGRLKMEMWNNYHYANSEKSAVKQDSKPATACFKVCSKSINVSYISKVRMGPKKSAHQTHWDTLTECSPVCHILKLKGSSFRLETYFMIFQIRLTKSP